MSAEPGRTKAYHVDLRWRIVWQRLCSNRTVRETAAMLCVSPSTVSRILERFERTGDVSASLATPRVHKLHEHDELVLIELVCDKPSSYLHEIQTSLLQITGTEASTATICNTLKRLGFTRKKLKYVAIQRCDILRAEYQAEVALLDSSMFVFVDESGCDRRNATRKFGYSLRGFPAKNFRFFSQGKRFSAIGVMTTTAFLDCYIAEGTVDGDVFYDFVQFTLLPHLNAFNGVNANSVVILDNCAIHHLADVVDLLHSVGALVLYLPPYSPDLMPIEECFNKVKQFLLENDTCFQAADDPTEVIRAAFLTVSPSDCKAWSADCGY